MATIEQVKALLRANFENDQEKFKTIALQIGAHEAKIGHTASAREIREIVQNPKYSSKNKIAKLNNKNSILEPKSSEAVFSDLVLTEDLQAKIKRIIHEYKKKELLRKNGLKNRSKLLITGEPGTGKTMTASVLATELDLPLYVIQIDKLVTKYMGETSIRLRQVFDQIYEVQGIYLFDEFDAIGSDRSLDNDVGEMRRILNSFLQYLENDDSYSIIIAATNNPTILDKALFRRFDDILEYSLPDIAQIEKLFKMKLKGFASNDTFIDEVYLAASGLNHADIVKICEDAIKFSILDVKDISKELVLTYIQDRKNLYRYKGA
ncbi:ATP-binding protein [Desulfitobacterium sp. THU1]|uniref:AAA family ATPase n=1 Tax=Desulfitobacterium sp. THU1 TaxID=3138072 RepID=UPI00312003CB